MREQRRDRREDRPDVDDLNARRRLRFVRGDDTIWCQNLGEFELAAITPAEVKSLVAKMRKDGKSVATIKNALGPLRRILVSAVEDTLIPANPISGVRLFGSTPRAARKIVPPTRE